LVSNPLILGAIPPGQPVQLTVPISLPDLPGNYTVNVTIVYNGGESMRSYLLDIRPKANLAVVSVNYPQPPNPSLSNLGALLSTITSPTLSPGASKVPITITIINEGPVEAKNVMVTISTGQVIQPHVSSSNPLSALTASQAFIGDLRPGQEINVTFLVDVDNRTSLAPSCRGWFLSLVVAFPYECCIGLLLLSWKSPRMFLSCSIV